MADDSALTRRTLACCYAVHRALGAGYPESAYRNALTRELERAELVFTRDASLPVLFHGEEIDRIPVDFVVDQLILEVRAKHSLEKEDTARAFACLKSSGLAFGLLVNFGAEELQVKRLSTGTRLT